MTKLKDNVIFRSIIISLCIILCFIGNFIPTVNGFTTDCFSIIFIFVGVLILWLTIGIGWPSVLCIFALGFVKNIGFNEVFKTSFGNQTFVFLLFTFILTYALSKTNYIKKIAILFVDTKLAKKNIYFFVLLFLTSVLLIGLFTSPSVLFMLIIPIVDEILEKIESNDKLKLGKLLYLGVGFTVSISSGMTTIGHVFPLLAMNAANVEISVLKYMAIGIPSGLIIFLLMIGILFIFIRMNKYELTNIDLTTIKEKIPPTTKKDIITLIMFIVCLLLWVVPALFENVSPEFYNFFNKYGLSMPPLLAVLVLFIVRVDSKPILEIKESFSNGVPWESLLMCAATLSLGSALTNEKVGFQEFLKSNLGSSLTVLAPIAIIVIFILWASLQTNLSSNMVTSTLVASVAGSVILSISNTTINLQSLIVCIGMISSFAFVTPPSMPHIAIVCTSKYATTKDVLIYGGITMVISILITLVVSYPLGLLLF